MSRAHRFQAADIWGTSINLPALVPILRVDAEDVADRQVVIGLGDDLDLVPGSEVALDDDPQVRSGAEGLA